MDDRSFNIRVPKKWARVAMVVTVTALIVAPLTAIASHTFTDVSDSNTFHADIDWLASAGITKGCNPPTNDQYCPNDDVTRGQMAAFMKRFNDYVTAQLGSNAVTARTGDEADIPMVGLPSYTEVSTVNIVAPSTGAVVVHYSVSGQGTGADVSYRAGISVGSDCSAVDFDTHVYGSLVGLGWDTASGSATFAVSSGTNSYTLCAHTNGSPGQIDGSSLTAQFVAEGSSTLLSTTGAQSDDSDFGN